MELTLSTHLLVYSRLDAPTLETLASCGYSQLEMWLARPHLPWADPVALAGLRAQLEDHGLGAASVHLPFYPSVDELRRQHRWSVIERDPVQRRAALEGAAQGLRAAEALGASCAVLHLGWPRDVWDAAAMDRARSALDTLLPVARACGVQLLLENILSEGTRAARLVALLDEVDPAGEAGVCLDLGHAHVQGDVLAELEAALPRLAHVHVHDNDGRADLHQAPGCGSLPWQTVLGRLQGAGYRGMGALELRDASRGGQPAAAVLEQEVGQARAFHRHWATRGLLPAPADRVGSR